MERVNGKGVEIFTKLVGSKKSVGTNALGVKAHYIKRYYDTFSLAIKNDYDEMRYRDYFNLYFSLPPEVAKEAKEFGRILMVGTLTPPFVGNGISDMPATLENPIETIDSSRYIAIKLAEIWFYSKKSGEVFHKMKINYQPVDLVER